MKEYSTLKSELLKDKEIKKAYEELSSEFKTLIKKTRTKQRWDQGKSFN